MKVSVDTLVKQYKLLDRNPILLCKKQGEEHNKLAQNEFIMIIMTDGQKEVLKKFGKNTICVDSTLGTNQYSFQYNNHS